ncbi:MAG: amino acid permease, partial [Ferruginibacter sp.]
GSKITCSGGSYAYVESALGEFPGFIVNWLYFIGWGVLGSAAVINIFADSISVFFPVFLKSLPRAILFSVLLGFMVLINIRGTKQSVGFLKFITIIKLLPLFAIVIFGVRHIKAANLNWEHLPTIKTFGDTALILFFAFAGFETTLNASGEVKNSKRTIPLGIFFGGILVLIVYCSLQIVTQGVLGAQATEFKNAPLAEVANQIVGPVGASILLIGAAVSCFGITCGDVLASPRLLFAGANAGLFPKFLGKVHPKFATPHLAVISYAACIFIFAVSGGFRQLAVLASAAILLIYLAVILATIKLRLKKDKISDATYFKIPGGFLIPLIGIAAIVWLLTSLKKWEILSTIIFVVAICFIYLIMKNFKKVKEAQFGEPTA